MGCNSAAVKVHESFAIDFRSTKIWKAVSQSLFARSVMLVSPHEVGIHTIEERTGTFYNYFLQSLSFPVLQVNL